VFIVDIKDALSYPADRGFKPFKQAMNKPQTSRKIFTAEEAKALLPKDWEVDPSGKIISRRFTFRNFAQALEFVNKLGARAEEVNHHPDLTLGWGYVGVTLTTHDAGGLTVFDFNLAGVADRLYGKS
jgi:4a-hydroxytetrahydrobiopterin dehydratase